MFNPILYRAHSVRAPGAGKMAFGAENGSDPAT
jgi:hypothetical protein